MILHSTIITGLEQLSQVQFSFLTVQRLSNKFPWPQRSCGSNIKLAEMDLVCQLACVNVAEQGAVCKKGALLALEVSRLVASAAWASLRSRSLGTLSITANWLIEASLSCGPRRPHECRRPCPYKQSPCPLFSRSSYRQEYTQRERMVQWKVCSIQGAYIISKDKKKYV